MNLLNLLVRARAGQDLAPIERAFLRVLPGIVISALLAGITAAQPFLNSQNVNWTNVLHTFVVAFGTSLGYALWKYWTAQADSPQNPAPVAVPTLPAPVPVPAPAAPLSGGEDLPLHYDIPTNPMLKNVPLPRARRGARYVY